MLTEIVGKGHDGGIGKDYLTSRSDREFENGSSKAVHTSSICVADTAIEKKAKAKGG